MKNKQTIQHHRIRINSRSTLQTENNQSKDNKNNGKINNTNTNNNNDNNK